jgi:hypothetical protein
MDLEEQLALLQEKLKKYESKFGPVPEGTDQ